MTDTYKLSFFKIHGRAQGIRYTFSVGKIPFEDDLVTDWQAMKPNTPLGFLPMLTINGNQEISQSLAIGRYAAKVANLYGSDRYEQGRIDMIADTANEMRESFIPVYFNHIEGQAKDDIVSGIKTKLTNLEKILGNNDYFVANKLSWADIHFYHCMEFVTQGPKDMPEFQTLLEGFPKLTSLYQRVGANPEIMAYKEKSQLPVMPARPAKPEK